MMTPAIIETIQAELSAALPRWGMSGRATLTFLSHYPLNKTDGSPCHQTFVMIIFLIRHIPSLLTTLRL
jgi:hypothetical protein